jgi:hypothetical protein
MKKSGIVSVLMLGVVATANAAPACYRTNEIEAEQAMRYQAKLMVLSDTCRSDSYGQFVHRNAELISAYQHELIDRFRRTNARHAVDEFDRYITRLANEYALGAGQQPIQSLCATSADFLNKAPTYGKDEFRHFVAAQAIEERASRPYCADEPRREASGR